ncbi:MAG: family 43 glycosylhydrolase [Janthinobacterium lividum]
MFPRGRALFFCFCCLFSVTSGAAQTVSNPILDRPDPFITSAPVNGRYLLLATPSDDLTIWNGPTVPSSASKATAVYHPTGLSEVWSPTLWHIEDRWWIYFTAREAGKEHAIYVLESDTVDPLGSYSFKGALDLGRPAIDPSLLTIGNDNYLMFVTVDGSANEIHMIQLKGPMQTKGHEALMVKPMYPWERGAGSTMNYPVTEGPTALYHGDDTFLVYSGSDTASPLYCLGLLRFKGGNPMKRKHWIRSPQPVFSAAPENGIYGPGRGTFAHGEDGSDWLLYAARTSDEATQGGRATRAQRFSWKPDGSPDFGVPGKDGPIGDVPGEP